MQGVSVCIEDSRLKVRLLSAGFENESNAKRRCHYTLRDRQWPLVFFRVARWALKLISSLSGPCPTPCFPRGVLFKSSLHRTFPFECPYGGALHQRVISPR